MAPKRGHTRKIKGVNKSTGPSNPQKPTWVGNACNSGGTKTTAASPGQSLDSLRSGGLGPFCPPAPQAVCKALQEKGPAACHGCGREMGRCSCAESWNWPKLVTVHHLSLPLATEMLYYQQTPETWDGYIRHRQGCLGSAGGRFWSFLLYHFPQTYIFWSCH